MTNKDKQNNMTLTSNMANVGSKLPMDALNETINQSNRLKSMVTGRSDFHKRDQKKNMRTSTSAFFTDKEYQKGMMNLLMETVNFKESPDIHQKGIFRLKQNQEFSKRERENLMFERPPDAIDNEPSYINPSFAIKAENKLIGSVGSSKCDCQMIRSASMWSLGLKEVERSIELAYLELILQAKYFIYIENQFFISSVAGRGVKNGIAKAILNRILKAHKDNDVFRVFILIPLLPGFEGELWEKRGKIMKIQLGLQLETLFHTESSIFYDLLKKEIDPSKYIQVFGLRTHGFLPSKGPVTEQIYIHSKMMIVDDQIVVVGSANINDRSMLGCRDSEFGIVIEDKEKVESKMKGEKFGAAKTALKLRQKLFGEHFGLNGNETQDPLSPILWERIAHQADQNTVIYRELFACYPDDKISTLEEINTFLKNREASRKSSNLSMVMSDSRPAPKKTSKQSFFKSSSRNFDSRSSQSHRDTSGDQEHIQRAFEAYQDSVRSIKGHAVQFPLHFLKNERDLTAPNEFDLEFAILPKEMFL